MAAASLPGIGALSAMPYLVLNLGGEMVYILEQRLSAQAISAEKAERVLVDVVRAMFDERFIEELFRPQTMYDGSAMREVFDRFAHSSIMRLNKTSMDKLFDLMTMGVKQQTLHILRPEELLQVILRHLDHISGIVSRDEKVKGLVASARGRAMSLYGKQPRGEMHRMRRHALRYFQDRRVKVSLFLQDGVQNLDGTLVVARGGVLPCGVPMPGRVKRWAGGGAVRSDSHESALECTYAETGPPASWESQGALPPIPMTTELGSNMYSQSRKGKIGRQVPSRPTPSGPKRPQPGPNAVSAVGRYLLGRSGTPDSPSSSTRSPPPPRPVDAPASAKATRAGLSLLADLIGSSPADSSSSSSSSRVGPIAVDLSLDAIVGGQGEEGDEPLEVKIDASTNRASIQDTARVLGFDDEEETTPKAKGGGTQTKPNDDKDDDDDLLAMMDAEGDIEF